MKDSKGAFVKRSEINKALKELEEMCSKCQFALPPFCHMMPEDWQHADREYDEVPYRLLCNEYPAAK